MEAVYTVSNGGILAAARPSPFIFQLKRTDAGQSVCAAGYNDCERGKRKYQSQLAVVEAPHAQRMGSGVFSVNFISKRSLAKEVSTRMQLKSTKEKTPDPFSG